MTAAILGLSAGFILVLVIVLLLLFKTALDWRLKLLAVVVSTGFYWIQYAALLEYGGWPSVDALPDEFVLIASHVREPNPSQGDEGIMYWWVRESGNPDQPPRVYELPYRSELHESSEKVVQEQKQGTQYVGRTDAGTSAASGGFGVRFERISKSERYRKP